MAEDHLALLMEIARAQNVLQQQMIEQNRQQRVNEIAIPLPTYSGKQGEDVLEFVEHINREATAGNWPEEQKLRLAKGALREVACEWRWLHDAEAPRDWIGWSNSLCDAFRRRYTFGEWESMVTTRVQLQDESGPQYALNKAKLRRHCPYPMSEADFIPFLVQGIRHRQFRTVLLQNLPLTTTAFIQVYGQLEQNSVRAPERELAIEARLEAQAKELDELKRQIGRPQRLQPYQQRPNRPTTTERRCYQCDRVGHLKRDCPENTNEKFRVGNDKAGPMGQVRQ